MIDAAIERQLIETFVKPALRDRWHVMLPGKRRQKHLSRLHHHFDFEADRMEKLKVRMSDSPADVPSMRRTGLAPAYFLSTRPELDGQWKRLDEVHDDPHSYVAYWPALRCALFRDEYDHYFLSNE